LRPSGLGDFERRYKFSQVSFPSKVLQVATGDRHSLAVTEDGKLWAWGFNQKSQCGLGPQLEVYSNPTVIPHTEFFISVMAGLTFSLALAQNGSVWSFGDNSRQVSRDSLMSLKFINGR
jgi:alpha-tubulin suppressor-like RCC1 family protein